MKTLVIGHAVKHTYEKARAHVVKKWQLFF